MYLFGGSQNFNSNARLYSLNLRTQAWNEVKTTLHAKTPSSIDEHTAVIHNDQMIVFGGFDNGYRSNKVQILNLKTFVWSYSECEGS